MRAALRFCRGNRKRRGVTPMWGRVAPFQYCNGVIHRTIDTRRLSGWDRHAPGRSGVGRRRLAKTCWARALLHLATEDLADHGQ